MARVSQEADTVGTSVNNIQPVTTGGYGGPHSSFDGNNFKAQARFETKIIELSARQGAVTDHGYTWAVVMIAYHDDNTTQMIAWPPAELAVRTFVTQQMQIFIETYNPKRIYFVASGLDIDPETFSWTF